MRKCEYCGHENPEEVTQCLSCKTEFLVPTAQLRLLEKPEKPRVVSKRRRVQLLACLWGGAVACALASGTIGGPGDLLDAVILFPMATLWLVRVPWANPAIGWPLYAALTVAAGCVRKLENYVLLYAILGVLLAMNVVGCHLLAHDPQKTWTRAKPANQRIEPMTMSAAIAHLDSGAVDALLVPARPRRWA